MSDDYLEEPHFEDDEVFGDNLHAEPETVTSPPPERSNVSSLFPAPQPEPEQTPEVDDDDDLSNLLSPESKIVAAVIATEQAEDSNVAYHLAQLRAKDKAQELFAAEKRGTTESWKRIDLGDHMRGAATPVLATMFARTDGLNLLYPGRTHSIFGESESGKSLIALAAAVREINNNHSVLYIDYEDDEQTTAERLRMFGATAAAVEKYFDYRRPEARPADGDLSWTELLVPDRYTLAIIDGVTAALATFGTSSIDNDAVAAWWQELPERIARQTGAAVIMIDHVTKSQDGRGRFAIGAQTKMSSISGAAYIVETTGAPIGLGKIGALAMYVAKDRPGQVRKGCTDYNASKRTHRVGTITVDSSTPGKTAISIEAGGTSTTAPVDGRNPELLEAISAAIQKHIADEDKAGHPVPHFSKSWIRTAVTGGNQQIGEMVDILVREGYLYNPSSTSSRIYFKRSYVRSADPHLSIHNVSRGAGSEATE